MTNNSEPRRVRWPRAANDYRTYMYFEPMPDLTEYEDVYEYALTIDGYKYAADKWGIAENSSGVWDKIHTFKHGDKWQGIFEDLRCCLFFYQRQIRWIESGSFAGEERKDFMNIYAELCRMWQKT